MMHGAILEIDDGLVDRIEPSFGYDLLEAGDLLTGLIEHMLVAVAELGDSDLAMGV